MYVCEKEGKTVIFLSWDIYMLVTNDENQVEVVPNDHCRSKERPPMLKNISYSYREKSSTRSQVEITSKGFWEAFVRGSPSSSRPFRGFVVLTYP